MHAHCTGALLEVIWAKPPDRTIMKFVRNSIKNGTQLSTPSTPGGNVTAGAPTNTAPLLLSPYAMNVSTRDMHHHSHYSDSTIHSAIPTSAERQRMGVYRQSANRYGFGQSDVSYFQ
jgi:hypothetical protein